MTEKVFGTHVLYRLDLNLWMENESRMFVGKKDQQDQIVWATELHAKENNQFVV